MEETARTVASYDAGAVAFAERWFHYRLHNSVRRFTAHLRPGARILDVGCGVGREVAHFQELGFDAVGLDLSGGMLAEARRRVVAVFVQADMRRLPLAGGSFDALWLCGSLVHLPKAQAPAVLQECRRVLGHGHICLSLKKGEGERWVTSPDDGSSRFFAYYHPAEIELLAERAGFQVLEAWENPPSPGQTEPWLNVIGQTRLSTPRVGASAAIFNESGEISLPAAPGLLSRQGAFGFPAGNIRFPGGKLDVPRQETRRSPAGNSTFPGRKSNVPRQETHTSLPTCQPAAFFR